MCRDQSLRKQNGAGLPVAIFVITVLAILVIGMAQLQESSGKAVSLQIQSQRAFFAAESGAQVAVTQVLKGGFCNASIVFVGQGLNQCEAELQGCFAGDAIDYDGDQIYRIKSVGRCGQNSEEEAIRAVEVTVR